MDAELLSRIQFALTAGFHFIFPPITIGFGLFIVLIEGLWLKTGDTRYRRAAEFFLKLFGLLFAIGVATGIVMVFQFGTNWPVYSNFVGDVFGSPLAIEATFAFFMESSFLGIALWGWNRVGKKTHFFSTVMVCVGAHLSAVWIIAANSFMQTPAGFELQKLAVGANGARVWETLPHGTVPAVADIASTKAAITNFWEMALNPSTLDRLTHTLAASWLCGAFLALGICGYYIVKKRADADFAKPCANVALAFGVISSLLMLATGHASARKLAHTQPEKLAAFEAHYETEAHAPLYLFGWVDEKAQTVRGVEVGGWFSLLAYGNTNAVVTGLRDLPTDDFLKKIHPEATAAELADIRPQYWAPINFTFQSFRAMVYLGGAMGFLLAWGCLLWMFKKLLREDFKWARLFWLACIPSVLLPLCASQVGWAAAEVGRQPWIVWHILKTQDAVTTTALPAEILASTLLFVCIFTVLTALFLYVFFKKIKQGPDIPHAAGY